MSHALIEKFAPLIVVIVLLASAGVVHYMQPDKDTKAMRRVIAGLEERGFKVLESAYLPSMEACKERVRMALYLAVAEDKGLNVVNMTALMRAKDPNFDEENYSFTTFKDDKEDWTVSCAPRRENLVSFMKMQKLDPKDRAGHNSIFKKLGF